MYRIRTCLVALALLPVSAPALSATGDQNTIEEVIVTATKREQTLQEVPVAVTAVTGETLERAGVVDLRNLSTVATSFNLSSSQTETGGTTLRIRGVGTTGNNIGLESAVGVFLDGVYLSRPGVALTDLMDVEQLEVLRGPQGTLFGRNTSAGAINIRTKKPNMQENEFFANLTAGNFDTTNIQLGASGPLVENKLAYRLSGAWREQDEGFLKSATGAESRTRDRYSLRGQLQWDISDTADLRIIADYSDADEQCCDAVALQDSPARILGAFAAAGLPADGGVEFLGSSALDDRDSNAEQFVNTSEQQGISAELNWNLTDTIELTWLSSWRDYEAGSIQQSDFVNLSVFSTGRPIANGNPTGTDIETWSTELRLAGETERLSWMVGMYYSDEDIVANGALGLEENFTAYTDAILWNFAFGPVLGAAPALAGVPLATGGTFGDVLAAPSPGLAFAGGADANGAFAVNQYTQSGKSWSVFTHNTFRLTDQFSLVAGLRWVDEEKDGGFEQLDASNDACVNTVLNTGALVAGAAGTGLEVVAGTIGGFSSAFFCFPFAAPADLLPGRPVTFDDTYEDDELVYTVKAVYEFTENLSSYLSFTHGYKSGGFNLDATAAIGGADPRFDAETNDSWEIGLKARFLDGRIQANVAIWDYEMEDFQVLEFTGVQFRTFNVPNAESQGFELELAAMLTEEFDLNFGYTYADSEYPNDCDGGGANAPASVSSLCGAALTNSPENAVTLGLQYETYFNDLLFFAGANYLWVDDRRTSTQPNLDFDIQEDNYKLNLRTGIGSQDGKWMVELWGQNITDERARTVTFNIPLRSGSRAAFLEAPRTYGITLRTRL